MKKLFAGLLAFALAAVFVVPAVAAPSNCPNGVWLVVNAWSLSKLPQDLQRKARDLVEVAMNRDSEGGTNLNAYRGPDFSRTLGAELRARVKTPAAVGATITVNFLDPKTLRARASMDIRTVEGVGRFKIPDTYLTGYVLETVWPDNFIAPSVSGGKHRNRVLPEELRFCNNVVHGLVQ